MFIPVCVCVCQKVCVTHRLQTLVYSSRLFRILYEQASIFTVWDMSGHATGRLLLCLQFYTWSSRNDTETLNSGENRHTCRPLRNAELYLVNEREAFVLLMNCEWPLAQGSWPLKYMNHFSFILHVQLVFHMCNIRWCVCVGPEF